VTGRAAAAVVVLGVTRLAAAGPATDASDDISPTAPLDAHAVLDAYLQHDFDDPASGRTELRAYDFRLP
jgi:hypothetical protein